MAGIITINCLETDNQYLLYAEHEADCPAAWIESLNSRTCPSQSLQIEWDRYGSERFEIGIAETFDADMDAADLEAIIDEWMGILEKVEFLGKF